MRWGTVAIIATVFLAGCHRDKPTGAESGASTGGVAKSGVDTPGEVPSRAPTVEATTSVPATDPGASAPPRSDVTRYRLRKRNLTDAELTKWLGTLDDSHGPTSLDARDNQLTAASVEALGKSKLEVFEVLMLSGNPIGDAGAKLIAAGQKFFPLDILWLEDTKLGPASVDALLGPSSKLRFVRDLSLSGNPIGDAGVVVLANSEKAKTLSNLYLSNVKMTDRGAKALASSPHLASLERLDVTDNALTKDGVAALKDSPHLAKTTVDVDPPSP